MNKAELVEALAQHYDGSKAEASRALNAVVQTITRTTAAGDKVAITGFGVFEKVERPARMVRNPRTGERKEAPATAVPRFRPGTELKAYVAGQRELPDLVVHAAADPAPARTSTRRPRVVATPDPTQEPLVAPADVASEPAPPSVPQKSNVKAAGQKAAPAEKAALKKVDAKKASVKKVDAKKAAPKKADAKKSDAKKSDGKKKDAKKTTPKKAVKKSGKK